MKSERIPSIVAYVVGAVFLLFGIMKFTDPTMTQTKFVEWGWPAWFGFVTGGLEVGAGALLLLARTRFLGAALGVGIMAGAIFTHLRIPEVGLLPMAIPLLIASAYVAWKTKPASMAGGAATPA